MKVGAIGAYRALLAKDLRTELRTMRSVPAMVLFAVTAFIIFRYGLDRTTLTDSLAGGVLWTTLLFASILGINRIFVAEVEEGGFDAFRLTPAPRTTFFLAKASVMFIYLVVLELIVVPVFALFFLSDWASLPPLIPVLLAANLGISVLGTLVSSMAVHSRARDLIVPLLLLPLVVPLMIAATGASAPLFGAEGPDFDGFWNWFLVIALYDGVFCLVGYAVFDFLIED
jgi:heme exporter protein B